ncbi:MAG: hypothetical protein WD649_01040 [Thermoleophilaceae bacterium]
MDLMGAWLRRSVGATLLIPLGIVLAAGLVAVVGGGLGGLTSLSQIAAGPALPDAGSVIDSNPALEDSGLAGSPALGGAAAGAPAGGGSDTPGAGTGSSVGTGVATGNGGTGGGEVVAQPPGTPGSPPDPGAPPSSESAPPPASTQPSAPPESPLGGNVEDITSGLGDTVTGPLQPVTDGLLDVLAPNR